MAELLFELHRGPVLQAAVWPHLVVVMAPGFDDDAGHTAERVEVAALAVFAGRLPRRGVRMDVVAGLEQRIVADHQRIFCDA